MESLDDLWPNIACTRVIGSNLRKGLHASEPEAVGKVARKRYRKECADYSEMPLVLEFRQERRDFHAEIEGEKSKDQESLIYKDQIYKNQLLLNSK